MSMKITIKTTGGNCEVEVPDESTVEMLRVIVFSAKPELGEDVRLIFQGKVLKNDEDLVSACGVKDGDAIAAAKGKSAPAAPTAITPTPPEKTEEKPAEKPAEPAEEPPPATFAPPSRAEEPAPTAPAAPVVAEEAAASEAPAKTEAAAPASPTLAPEAAPAPVPLSPGEAQEPAAKRPCTEEKEEKADAPAAEAPAPPSPTNLPTPVVEDLPATPENLMVLAARVESGEVPPEEVAAMLRKAANKVEMLGGAVNELAQALQLVNVVSGRVLQQIGVPVVSAPNGAGTPMAQAPKEEEPRSFMVKKGDADVQALHERANAMGTGNRAPTSPAHGSSGGTCAWGGNTNASATPMSREDMDKARQARLARLEKQQADKQKEKEEAEEKSRSRLALERMGTVGPAKPIGKF